MGKNKNKRTLDIPAAVALVYSVPYSRDRGNYREGTLNQRRGSRIQVMP